MLLMMIRELPAISTHGYKKRANKSREITTFEYNDQNIKFNKGDEIGKFTMGSTVICLFEKNSVDFEKSLETQIPTKVGEKMASTHK